MEAPFNGKWLAAFAGALLLTAGVACRSGDAQVSPPVPPAPGEKAGLPNKAAEYCEDQGYRYEIHSAVGAAQTGVCVFSDGSTCNAWEFFYGRCSPAGEVVVIEQDVTPVYEGVIPFLGPLLSQGDSEEVAQTFIMKSATFAFDGIEDSLELVHTLIGRGQGSFVFTFEFQSANAGYGDRTGQEVAPAITPHAAVVAVEYGSVRSAVLDGQWDMVARGPVPAATVAPAVEPSPEGPRPTTPYVGDFVPVEESEDVAREFVRGSATFAFDGIEESLKLTETALSVLMSQYSFTFEFDCRHAGYGDRTEQALAEGVTHHLAVVMVDGSEIESAIMDGRWDMLVQGPAEMPESGVFFPRQNLPLGPERGMAALFFGELLEVDGCLRAKDAHDDYLVIWRHDNSLNVEDGAIQVLNAVGEVAVEVGDQIRLGGGESPSPEPYWSEPLRDSAPAHCLGPYWIVGTEVGRLEDVLLKVQEVIGLPDGARVRVQGHLVAEGEAPVKLCRILLESDPPQCGEPSLRIEGLGIDDTPGLETHADVTWSAGLIELTGIVRDGVLTVD